MTPTLAQALSLIAPQYNAAQHKRAAERMVQDMEKTAHTPGPWRFSTRSQDGIGDFSNEVRVYQADRTSYWVADCGMEHDPERIANARLIAASPDLLAALEAALPTLQSHMERYPNDKDERRIYDAARAAIDKAKGVGSED